MKLHLLAANEDLAPDVFRKAADQLGAVSRLHRRARAYIDEMGLDPEVFMPGNIWATIDDGNAFLDWRYDLVNYAKVLSPFSGFHSLIWGRMDEGPDAEFPIDAAAAQATYADFMQGRIGRAALAAELEERFRLSLRMRRSAPALMDQYDHLVEGVPPRYHLRLPPRGGEMGLRHRDRIVNSDLIAFQSRMNALYGAGVLERLEAIIARQGCANYAEIGPGAAQFASALRACLGGRLNVYLIDLPLVMANGCAYLACVEGPDAVTVVSEGAGESANAYVYLANYLLPRYATHLPALDLIHNANSLNEMNASQVTYYLQFAQEHLAPGGCLHLSGTFSLYEYHQDVIGAAASLFPHHDLHLGDSIGPARVIDPRHMFCHAA